MKPVRGAWVAAFLCIPSAALADPPPAPHAVPFPHPVITEVMYAAPGEDPSDPNLDGVPDSAGDEFVEIMNPHDRPIDIKGYMIVDKAGFAERIEAAKPGAKKAKQRGLRFVFPAQRLEPGEIAVVFNGYHARMKGPVGDASRPAGKHPQFHDAYIYTMRNSSRTRTFSNGGDFAALLAPDGAPIDVVTWGKDGDEPIAPPDGAVRSEESPRANKCSVQRLSPDSELLPHLEINDEACSPGVIPPAPPPKKIEKKPKKKK